MGSRFRAAFLHAEWPPVTVGDAYARRRVAAVRYSSIPPRTIVCRGPVNGRTVSGSRNPPAPLPTAIPEQLHLHCTIRIILSGQRHTGFFQKRCSLATRRHNLLDSPQRETNHACSDDPHARRPIKVRRAPCETGGEG